MEKAMLNVAPQKNTGILQYAEADPISIGNNKTRAKVIVLNGSSKLVALDAGLEVDAGALVVFVVFNVILFVLASWQKPALKDRVVALTPASPSIQFWNFESVEVILFVSQYQ